VRRPFIPWLFAALLLPSAPVFAQDEVERALAEDRARAERGEAVAQFSLGSFLFFGADDLYTAVTWFQKAAAQGYPPAEFQVGQLYDFGFGVGQDDEQALNWYRKAADHGNAAAQRVVADFYRKGIVVREDPVEAVRWYRKAAEGDDIRAQYQLAQMSLDGAGIPVDNSAAYIWFMVAAGQAPLEDNRKELIELANIAKVRMSPAALAAADRELADRGRR
jgi:TPR repeat protein